MSARPDRSLTQRLWLGFGSIVLVLLATFIVVQREQARSSAATTRLERLVLPRAAAAAKLEREVLLVGIALRSYLLTGRREHREELDAQLAETRRALQSLAGMPKDQDGAVIFARVEPSTLRFLSLTDSIAAIRPQFGAPVEVALNQARDPALLLVQEYAQLQRRKADTSLVVVNSARSRVTRSLLFAMVLGLLGALLAGTVTTRSVRRAADRLLRIAGRFERGEWRAGTAVDSLAVPAIGTLPPRDEFTRIGVAFQSAAHAVELRERELTIRSQLAAATASSLDAHAIARAVLPLVVSHTRAGAGTIHAIHDGTEWPLLASHGTGAIAALTATDPLSTEAVSEQRVVVAEAARATGHPLVATGAQLIACVPLRTGSHVHGVLTLAGSHDLATGDTRFLDAVALQIGVGLQNARTFADVQRLLAEVSRQRAAHEEQHRTLEMQARALADADAHKDRFLALLAHELRNPLAVITNSVHLLAEASPHEDGAQLTRIRGMLMRQTHQLTRIVDDLLDVTRIAQGKVRIERTRIDLSALVEHCVSAHRTRRDGRSAPITLHGADEPLYVDGDDARLSQLVDNLLDNAVKFTPADGLISVSLLREGTRLVLVVRDTGVGIEPSLLPRLFEPFVQAEGSPARSQAGLGLGLSLVRAYAELHDGAVSLRSEGVGKGTTVILRLPLAGEAPVGTTPRDGVPLEAVRGLRTPITSGDAPRPRVAEGSAPPPA